MIIKAKSIKIGIVFIFFGLFAGILIKQIAVPKNEEAFSGLSDIVVVCDAGHGEPDGGAVGISGTLEKDINLDITKKVAETLENRGIKVIMTRTADNGIYDGDAQTIRQKKLSDMHKRLDIVNSSGADLFISIHMNSFSDSNVRGVHVFYNKEDENLKNAANMIKERIAEITGAKSHEIKSTSDSLYLMQKSSVPAILVECGFLSNPEEEEKLTDEKYRSKMAWAIADAIISFAKRS